MKMLEMTKKVLENVSFDKTLFKKELKKATKWLKKEELMLLQAWCFTKFGERYQDLINEVFNQLN